MALTIVRIANFRNLSAVEFSPLIDGLNIISGDNGSGKTSLLEAIYFLGHGRSFRTSALNRLVKQDQEKFSIFSQLVSDAQRDIPVGIERDVGGNARLRIADKDITTLSELAYHLPIRVINSQSHDIFEAGPSQRRKYLDWGIFYQSDKFLPCWRHFERVLRQRNALLRDKRPKNELEVWTNELIKYGLELDQFRRSYIQALTPLVAAMANELLSISKVELRYSPGWDDGQDFGTVLAENLSDEFRFGCTQYGPHRADLDIVIEGISARHFLSRGQQKLLICAMILAQGVLFAKDTNKRLIYLVDDLPSELDLQSRKKLISLLSKQQMQIFITAIESQMICAFLSEKPEVPMKVFHVEHGYVVDLAEAR